MKRIFSIIIICTIIFTANISYAGKKQRHRWQGALIGAGSVLILQNLYDTHHKSKYNETYCEPYENRCHRGHYETKRVYVEPTYDYVWNPGHYKRNGQWVCGEYIKIEKTSGYYITERVWVE